MKKKHKNRIKKSLKYAGKTLWSAVKKGSRNLEKNVPEFKQMAKRKSNHRRVFSDLSKIYLPQTKSKMWEELN